MNCPECMEERRQFSTLLFVIGIRLVASVQAADVPEPSVAKL